MKKPYFIALLALILPAVALTGTAKAANPETEKVVLKMEEEMVAALTKPDGAAVGSMLAENYFFVDPAGATQNKAQFVADITSGDLKLTSTKPAEMKVQVSDADMAVVTYRSTDVATFKGKDIGGEYRWIDIFMKRDGKWFFVTGQGTKIATTP